MRLFLLALLLVGCGEGTLTAEAPPPPEPTPDPDLYDLDHVLEIEITLDPTGAQPAVPAIIDLAHQPTLDVVQAIHLR